MNGWDLLVERGDLRRTKLVAADPDIALADGEALLAVESFALTANNVTYGAAGDMIGYWKFFPAPEGQGRIPVWGFAQVVRSNAADAPVGLRLFGYWPMSSHTVLRLEKRSSGFVETSPHRAELPGAYNAYQAAEPGPGDDWRALLGPLFMTSFILDDQIAEAAPAALVLSSASSKTAMGLAWLARRRGIPMAGLTSAAHLELLRSTGLYDALHAYEDIANLSVAAPATYVDFAGRSTVTHQVHDRLGGALAHSIGVGLTHWDAERGAPPASGPTPSFFFAPDRIRQRMKDWGPEELDRRFSAELTDFIAGNPWLTLKHHVGADALQAIYAEVVAGKVQPDEGHIVRPS